MYSTWNHCEERPRRVIHRPRDDIWKWHSQTQQQWFQASSCMSSSVNTESLRHRAQFSPQSSPSSSQSRSCRSSPRGKKPLPPPPLEGKIMLKYIPRQDRQRHSGESASETDSEMELEMSLSMEDIAAEARRFLETDEEECSVFDRLSRGLDLYRVPDVCHHSLVKPAPAFCRFCFAHGVAATKRGLPTLKPADVGIWSTHNDEDADGNITCPRIFSISCGVCGASGFSAHPARHCPFNRQ